MDLSSKVIQGDVRAAAKLITMVENDFQNAQKVLKNLYQYSGKSVVIGITGSPGSGKSTITDRLTKHIRKLGKKVGIIAIDPSSPFSGGAILGDRIRMQDLATDKDVFIRSIGTRGHLGGLSRSTEAVVKIMDAMGKEVIFIETVGVGQSEIEVIKVSDIILLVLVPGMGDDIQVIKAGIMEIGDIFVVNKADREGADKLIAEIEMMLHLDKCSKKNPPIVKTIGTENVGIEKLWVEIDRLFSNLQNNGNLYQRRKNRIKKEIYDLFLQNWQDMFFQLTGEKKLGKEVEMVLNQEIDPYSVVNKLTEIFKKEIFKEGTNLLNKIDHIGIAVKKLEDALTVFQEILEVKCSGIEEVEEQKVKVACLPVGESKIELLESTSEESVIARYIEKRGEGIHHIAFQVKDIVTVIDKLNRKGIKLIDQKPRIGASNTKIAFLHPKSTNGVLIELCEYDV